MLKQMGTILHDLCQPMTTLQCRLELASIIDTPEDHRDAVALGLVECARMSVHIHALREVLRRLSPNSAEAVRAVSPLVVSSAARGCPGRN